MVTKARDLAGETVPNEDKEGAGALLGVPRLAHAPILRWSISPWGSYSWSNTPDTWEAWMPQKDHDQNIGCAKVAFADRRTCPGFAPNHGLPISRSEAEEVGDAHEAASARSTQGLLSNDLYALLGTPAEKAA